MDTTRGNGLLSTSAIPTSFWYLATTRCSRRTAEVSIVLMLEQSTTTVCTSTPDSSANARGE